MKMTEAQAQRVAEFGQEAYEVRLLSFDGAHSAGETPSQLYRRTIREQCHALGVAERDFYVYFPDAGAAFQPEVVTGWRGGPVKRGMPMVTSETPDAYLRSLGDAAIDRYERALADGLDPVTAHRQAAGDTVVANDAIEHYARRRKEGMARAESRVAATTESAAQGLRALDRDGGVLPPESEWERPAPVDRPDLERDAAPAEIARDAIDHVTDLVVAGVRVDDAHAAVTTVPGVDAAVRDFRARVEDGASWAEARQQVLDGLHVPAEFGVEDVTGSAEETGRAALAERVAECAQTVDGVDELVRGGDRIDEDTERAERCARWNADDEAAADDTSEGWDQ
ncbi:hypothetical protein [Amycolatopsis regifaucium]|uniref:Uncharacterized protein n=1 Tax=Amycolatopsis regifaucium TaxID=546365 RepID=A0A154MDZ7_9PSEU|nr:hypothetical protein [Amycolatopsis regifaucium]KZB82794.1 hypothetical protein AVL48_37475 [Amycolatopsis regifaucium]OKA03373.1 hypothetical protein ATP06_0236830 [Amycolatopsis regifaucium]SFJ75022.1 hypothetical protein SAMN04489731_1392 [Amycolatopsis regifaucium]